MVAFTGCCVVCLAPFLGEVLSVCSLILSLLSVSCRSYSAGHSLRRSCCHVPTCCTIPVVGSLPVLPPSSRPDLLRGPGAWRGWGRAPQCGPHIYERWSRKFLNHLKIFCVVWLDVLFSHIFVGTHYSHHQVFRLWIKELLSLISQI